MANKVNEQLVFETLNDYAKRARWLYKWLFLEAHPLDQKTAQQYLDFYAEYDFIIGMFRVMNIFDWHREDFEIDQ